MPGRRRRSGQLGSTIFPFLSVLFCTIGVMTLVLVAGSLKMTFKDPDLPGKMAEQTQTLEALTSELESAKKELAKTEEEKDGLKDRAKDAMARAEECEREAKEHEASLASVAKQKEGASQDLGEKTSFLEKLAAEARETLAIPEKIEIIKESTGAAVARDEVRKERDGLDSEAKTLRSEADVVRAEFGQVADRLATLKKLAGPPVARFKVKGLGADKPPVYVELGTDSVTVHTDGLSVPAGTTVPKAKALGEKGFLANLAAEQARHETSHYVVFLVRAGAHDVFRAAATSFRKWRADFGHEPVDAGWRLAFGERASDATWPPGVPPGGGGN